ncbi:MAG: hypothetical protein WAQ98_20695 [Blastocatellia bacterium]
MRSFKFKLVVVLLSLLWWIVPCLAQNPTITSRLDLKNQASAPSNPDNGFSTVYVTNTGVVRVRLSDGTDVPVLTGSIDTDDVAEGSTNLYHTTSRVRAALSAGTNITYDPETGVISATGGGSGALSALTAATASNDINNANNSQIWRWNTLAGATGLQLASSSTAAASNAQVLFDVALSGANSNSTQTTIAARIANTHTGTSSTNIGLSLTASGGTNNYALLIPSGRVGIGASTTTATIGFGTTLALKTLAYYESGNTLHGAGVISGATVNFYPTGGRVSFGALSTGDGSTYTEKVFVNDTRLDLTGTNQNITFGGGGGLIFSGTTLNSGSKISFGGGINSQAIALYVSANTKHYIGIESGRTVLAHTTGAKTSIGAVSNSDGTTFTPYFEFNDNGKLDITQGSITTNKPYINHTVTTNEGSTQFILDDSTWTDIASASTSLFSRKRVGSTVMYSLRKDGFGYFAGNIGANITSPSVIINPFDSPTAGTIIQSAGFVSSQRTGQVGFHLFNNGGVAEWIVTQPASGTSHNFQINKVVSNTQTKLFELTTDGNVIIPVGSLNTRSSFAAKTSGYTLLSTDSGGVFTNGEAVGSVTFSLPAAAAGLHYKFYVTTNQNFVIDAAGSDTIRLGASVTASGGNLTSNVVGDSLELIYIGSGQWGVLGKEQGTWAVN